MQEFFSRVELSRYPDSLQVTDAGMILAYIRSVIPEEDLQEEELRALERELKEMIEKDGRIFIAKDSGLFVARKRRSNVQPDALEEYRHWRAASPLYG